MFIKTVDIIKITVMFSIALITSIIKVYNHDNPSDNIGIYVILGLLLVKSLQSAHQVRSSQKHIENEMANTLYAKGQDSGDGVLFSLFNSMEEQEVKEVALGYLTLLRCQARSEQNNNQQDEKKSSLTKGVTMDELDKACEEWLYNKFGNKCDFEVDDALHKLIEMDLVYHADSLRLNDSTSFNRQPSFTIKNFNHKKRYIAIPLSQGVEILQDQFDKVCQNWKSAVQDLAPRS